MIQLSRIESYHLGGKYRGSNFNSNISNNAIKLENEIVLTERSKNKKIINMKKKKSNNNTFRSFKSKKSHKKSQECTPRNKSPKSTKSDEVSFAINTVEQLIKNSTPKHYEGQGLSQKIEKMVKCNF